MSWNFLDDIVNNTYSRIKQIYINSKKLVAIIVIRAIAAISIAVMLHTLSFIYKW